MVAAPTFLCSFFELQTAGFFTFTFLALQVGKITFFEIPFVFSHFRGSRRPLTSTACVAETFFDEKNFEKNKKIKKRRELRDVCSFSKKLFFLFTSKKFHRTCIFLNLLNDFHSEMGAGRRIDVLKRQRQISS